MTKILLVGLVAVFALSFQNCSKSESSKTSVQANQVQSYIKSSVDFYGVFPRGTLIVDDVEYAGVLNISRSGDFSLIDYQLIKRTKNTDGGGDSIQVAKTITTGYISSLADGKYVFVVDQSGCAPFSMDRVPTLMSGLANKKFSITSPPVYNVSGYFPSQIDFTTDENYSFFGYFYYDFRSGERPRISIVDDKDCNLVQWKGLMSGFEKYY